MTPATTSSIVENGHVFIVDDDPSVRKGLARLLGSYGLEVQVFASACEFLQNPPARQAPSCIVLDIRMPELDGLELQQELASADFRIPIVFVSGHGDIPASVRAMKGGAIDFLSKPVDEQDLLEAVQRALAEDARRRTTEDKKEKVLERVRGLTARELEIMRHVLAGRLNKQIAYMLGITEKTVKVHRGRVMEKMAAESVADLVRLAEKADITPAEVPSRKSPRGSGYQ